MRTVALLVDLELRTSVPPPAAFRRIGADGTLFAVRDGFHLVLGKSLSLQILLSGVGTTLAKGEIVLISSALVAVAFNSERNADGIGAFHVSAQNLAGFGSQEGFVVVKVDVLEFTCPDTDAVRAFFAWSTGTWFTACFLFGNALLTDALFAFGAIAIIPAFATTAPSFGPFVLPALATGTIDVGVAASRLFDASVIARTDFALVSGFGRTLAVRATFSTEQVDTDFVVFLAVLIVFTVGVFWATTSDNKCRSND